MALADSFPVTIHRADDHDLVIKIVDTAGVDVDLTGLTGTQLLYVVVEKDASSIAPQTGQSQATALFTKSIGSGIVLTSPLTGVLTVTIDSADTDGERPRDVYHELQITLASKVTTVMRGVLTIAPEVAEPGGP